MNQAADQSKREAKRTYVKPRLNAEGDWKDITAGSISTPSGHTLP